MLNLSELSAFVSVEIDVVDPEGAVTHNWNSRCWGISRVGKVALGSRTEKNVKSNFVILKCDEWKCTFLPRLSAYLFRE